VPTDYYELLEVERNSTEDEIKRAYRRLARTHHPDANGGDPAAEARFKEITAAYETLRDPERRRRYDMFGPEAERGAGAGARGFDGTVFGGGFGDIFETFFGQATGFGPGAGRQSRVPDAEIAVQLTFEQSVFGAEIEVPLDLPVVCESCDGSGARPGTTPVSCPDCAGSGQVRRVRQSLLGQMVTAMPCGRCEGSGEYVSSPCTDCRGNGQRPQSRTITVQVPAGVDNGSVLRVAGQGPAGPRGRGTGDLYVHLRVEPHKRFERAGNNLLMSLHIQMTHAALGAEVEIESLDGQEKITIPPGIQTGKVIHLKGKGVPDLHGGRRRGDLLVNIIVDTPTRLSRHEEDVLRQFAELRGDDVAKAEGGLLHRLRAR
jgi:molecular chaperone DnaJ